MLREGSMGSGIVRITIPESLRENAAQLTRKGLPIEYEYSALRNKANHAYERLLE